MHVSEILKYIPYASEGGWIMPIIYLFSLISTAIFFERLWFLRRKRIIPPDLADRILPLIEEEKWEELEKILKPEKSAFERIISVIITNRKKSLDVLKEMVESSGRKERENLERGLGFISLTVSISPLLGLLGTVSGMIKVFAAISHQAIGNPEKLAGGISEALLTTFAGLTAAIVALLMLNFLNSKVKRFSRELEDYSVQIIEKIVK